MCSSGGGAERRDSDSLGAPGGREGDCSEMTFSKSFACIYMLAIDEFD